MEEVSLKVTASASTSATTACSIFGQDSQNKTGYDPSGKEPISFFFPGSPGKACLEHYGGDTQAEAKPSHTKVWNKMLIKGLKRGEDKENMLTPVQTGFALRNQSCRTWIILWSKEAQVTAHWNNPG